LVCLLTAEAFIPLEQTEWVGVPRRPIADIDITMEARRIVNRDWEGILRRKPPEFWIEVPGLGIVEPGFGVEDVPGEGEAVGALGEL
jgi:hypothetical protein